jgi:hypothetical protein
MSSYAGTLSHLKKVRLGCQGRQIIAEEREHTDAMIMKVLRYVVAYRLHSEMKAYPGQIDRGNTPDVQAPTTTTFFPS